MMARFMLSVVFLLAFLLGIAGLGTVIIGWALPVLVVKVLVACGGIAAMALSFAVLSIVE